MVERPVPRPPLVVAVVLAGLLGFVQFGLLFSDDPGTTAMAPRIIAASCLGAVSGIALGRMRPAEATRLALFSVWGAVLWGGMFWVMDATHWIAVLVLPAGTAVLGGWAGGAWGGRPRKGRSAPPSVPPPGSTS